MSTTTQKLNSNYPEFSANDLTSTQKVITLRSSPYQYEDPLSWAELDNNFELLRYSINSLVDDVQTTFSELNYDDAIANLDTKITVIENQVLDSRVSALENIDAESRLNSIEGVDLGNKIPEIEQSIIDGDNLVRGEFQEADHLIRTRVETLEGFDINNYSVRIGELENYTTNIHPAEHTVINENISSLQTSIDTLEQQIANIDLSADVEIGAYLHNPVVVTYDELITNLQEPSSVIISEDADFNFASNAEAIIPNVSEDRIIFDYSRNALRVYDFNPSVPSVSSDDRHTLQLQRHTDRGTFGAANTPVGVSGQVNCALNAKSIVGPNVLSNEWAILGVVENFPDKNNTFAHAESEHVGGYFQGKRHGSGGKTWGATIEAWDLADTYDDVQHGSCVTVELDMTANFDAGANRVIVDGVLRKTNEELDRPGIIAGMRLRDNHENGSGGFFYNGYEFKGAVKYSAFSAEIVGDNSDDGSTPWGNAAFRALGTTYAHFQSQGTPTFSFRDVSNAAVGIGLDEATYSNCAIRLGTNQRVVLDGSGIVSFSYNGASIKFNGAPVETTYMKPSGDSSNPLEVYVNNGWKKVEVGPADSGGAGYRSLRVLN